MSDEDKRPVVDNEPFDPSKRELCPDGMCVGVIGPDGCCKVCGKRGTGAVSARASTPAKEAGPSEPPADWRPAAVPGGGEPANDGPATGEGRPAASGAPDFERERVPCPDGMCTGVIGRNGKCGTCGKLWSWKER